MSGWKVFKTYVIGSPSGNGKKPKEKVKGRAHIHDWDEVQDEDCFGAILQDDYVDVSFDTPEMFSAFLNMAEQNEWRCLALPSTHGGHTYWKKPKHRMKGGTDVKLAVGFVADIHHGGTYIPLRVHGKDRFPARRDVDPGEEYQELPEELWTVKTDMDLWGANIGDGRNSALFGYILVLQKLQLDNDTIRRIITNANSYVFDTPLDRSELDVILRDEAFAAPVFYTDTGAFLQEELARYLVNNYHVVLIDRQLHIYVNGVYKADPEEIERIMIEVIPGLKRNSRTETLASLRLLAPKMDKADARYIAFKNGIYDLADHKLIPFTPDVAVTNKIDANYDPQAYSAIGDRVLNDWSCNDPTIRALLEECVGYCLYRENDLRKAFILTGGKRNGKSVFLDWLKNTLGEENICALDLKELSDRFSTAMMYGKLANIGDDISDDFLQGTGVALFKKIVAGNRIKAEQKGKDPFEFNPYVKLLFSANEIPRIRDSSGAVLDRLIIIPFDATFEENDPKCIPDLRGILRKEEQKMYLIRVAIEGLKRVRDRDGFTASKRAKDQREQYRIENNPLLGFIADTEIDQIVNHSTKEVYNAYAIYCNDNGLNAIGRQKFTRLINTQLGLKSEKRRVSGKSIPVFERDES